ncbi:MAG: hypothetical protein AB1384_09780 [Actinomycetota bacterium]
MSKIKKCRQCGVLLGFSRGLVWRGNGVITQARDPDHRFVFSESDFLDEIFKDLEEGTIYDPGTGRRMAAFSPESIEAILKDIGKEMGGDLADAVIDAQRRFVRRMLGRDDALIGQPGFRDKAGLRGLGYIRELEPERKHSMVHIENPCLPLFMVGISQALFEMGLENESANRRWEIRPDGDLVIELWA